MQCHEETQSTDTLFVSLVFVFGTFLPFETSSFCRKASRDEHHLVCVIQFYKANIFIPKLEALPAMPVCA